MLVAGARTYWRSNQVSLSAACAACLTMTVHIVKQGDSITALGERHGFFGPTIWNHPDNEEIAGKRAHMNELLPGDKIVIPELTKKNESISSGKIHTFRRKGIPAKLVLKVADLGLPRANQEYTLRVNGEAIPGATDGDGVLEAFVPAQAKQGLLVIGPDAFELTIKFGQQDPQDELSGIQRRLANLGYLKGEPSGKLDDVTREAVMAFEMGHELRTEEEPTSAQEDASQDDTSQDDAAESEADGEPTDVHCQLLVDYHRGRDFVAVAKRMAPWPAEPKGRVGTVYASLAASGGSGGDKRGGDKGDKGGDGGGGKSGPPGWVNVFNLLPPPGYYVIIGRGVTGLYNHLTMLTDVWGRARLTPNMPVMHLGYAEPWGRRGHERMGQWPRMLDFFQGVVPGLALQNVPAEDQQDDWLRSSEFAANLQRVENRIRQEYLVTLEANGGLAVSAHSTRTLLAFKDGFASTIETYNGWLARGGAPYGQAGNGLPVAEDQRWQTANNAGGATMGDGSVWHNNLCPYRISVFHNNTHSFVYAKKIDVCTGPGQPRLFRNNYFGGNVALRDEHKPAYDVVPARYDQGHPIPRIVNGNDYIGAVNNPQHKVLVFKGNPVAAQSVQSALDMPGVAAPVERVWWIVNKSLHLVPPAQAVPGLGNDADVPGRRNLLEQVGTDALINNEAADITTHHSNPPNWVSPVVRNNNFNNRLMRVGFHEIAGFREHPDGRIIVDFNLHPRGNVNTPVLQYIPRLAERSLRRMQAAHAVGAYPAEMTTRHDPEPATGDAREHIESLTVDQVVYSMGQDRGPGTVGTAAYLVQLLGAMDPVELEGFPAYITDGQADPDDASGTAGRVRILGAACMDGPGIGNAVLRGNVNQGLRRHDTTVPQEAPAGGGGMNMAITNIRRANACTTAPVRINFASAAELQTAGLSQAVAQWIVAARTTGDRGFSRTQCAAMLTVFALTPFGLLLFGGLPGVLADQQLLLLNANNRFAF